MDGWAIDKLFGALEPSEAIVCANHGSRSRMPMFTSKSAPIKSCICADVGPEYVWMSVPPGTNDSTVARFPAMLRAMSHATLTVVMIFKGVIVDCLGMLVVFTSLWVMSTLCCIVLDGEKTSKNPIITIAGTIILVFIPISRRENESQIPIGTIKRPAPVHGQCQLRAIVTRYIRPKKLSFTIKRKTW